MESLYPENAWITPCELFKPFYSYTVANYMLNKIENWQKKSRKQTKKLQVIEIGPGTGTFADSMLDFFKNYDLNLYRNTEYVFVEISPQLIEQCKQLMNKNHKELVKNGNIKFFNGSIFEY
jgi:SAM-dependent MidA family methyltransferase